MRAYETSNEKLDRRREQPTVRRASLPITPASYQPLPHMLWPCNSRCRKIEPWDGCIASTVHRTMEFSDFHLPAHFKLAMDVIHALRSSCSKE